MEKNKTKKFSVKIYLKNKTIIEINDRGSLMKYFIEEIMVKKEINKYIFINNNLIKLEEITHVSEELIEDKDNE